MQFGNYIRRALLALTSSGKEGARLVGTSSKSNLGSATTVEAALASVNTFVGGISETIDDRVGTLLVAGTNVTLTYNDGAGTLTVASAAGSHTHTASDITDFTEAVDDRVGSLIVAGTGIGVSYNDGAGTFTISIASHTHTASQVTDFSEAVDDRVAALLVAGSNVTLTYNDGSNTLTIAAAGGSGFPLVDSNGNEELTATATASAVNHVNLTNAVTGSGPTIASTGDDTDVDLNIDTKGVGLIKFKAGTFRDFTTPADASTITLDCSISNVHMPAAITANRIIALSNVRQYQVVFIGITQDGSGLHTITWPGTIRWAGGSAPTLTTTANKRDWICLVCTGSGTYDGFVVGANL